MRYFLDEHISPAVADGLRRHDVDCIDINEAERRGESDESHLEWAAAASRVIVTHDGRFAGLARGSSGHAGLVFCPADKFSLGGLIEALGLLAQVETAESVAGRVVYL